MTRRLNNNRPNVSVLLPVYNNAPYLEEAIQSVLGQTFHDFELLTRDDGSTDDSVSILRKYEAEDIRVRVYLGEHKGIAGSRNALARSARGRYLANMDADDICLPDRLEKQVEYLDEHSDCVGVGSWVEFVNAQGQPIRILSYPISHSEIDNANIEGRMAISNPSTLMRRDAAFAIGLFPEEYKFADDLAFWIRLAEIGPVANIAIPLLKYRIHGAASSETHLDEQFSESQVICHRAWLRRGVSREYKGNKHWRSAPDAPTRHQLLLKYAWIAWSNNHRATWWTFTRQALLLRPFSPSSWRLLAFGFLRSPSHQRINTMDG